MREIKFRAWDKKNKEMLPNGNGIDVLYILSTSGGRSEEYEFLQFSGLKDKKGKEIYEGDIVKWNHGVDEDDNGINEIIFKEGCFFLGGYTLDAFIWRNDTEVIGNIYENPELLK